MEHVSVGAQGSASTPIRILLIGPLPPPIGGATKLFKYLVDDLTEDPRCDVKVIDISRPESRNRLVWNMVKALEVARSILALGRRVDVISFHANQRGRVYFGPVVYLASRVLGKPLVVRAFGGAFHETVRSMPAIERFVLSRTYLRAARCLFETRLQTRYFRKAFKSRAEWFPNYAKHESWVTEKMSWSAVGTRYIFLGRVVPEKGVDALYEIEASLPDGTSIDIYGPLGGAYSEEALAARGVGRVRYRGVLAPEKVIRALKQYDSLILPTSCPTEGYPGAIIEALVAGRPVIVTDMQSIREIVDVTCGLLIPPNDVRALLRSIEMLSADSELYRRLCRGARERGRRFESGPRTEQFLRICREVATRGQRSG